MLHACLLRLLRSGITRPACTEHILRSASARRTTASTRMPQDAQGARHPLQSESAAATVVAIGSHTAGTSTQSEHSSQSAAWKTCRGPPKRRKDGDFCQNTRRTAAQTCEGGTAELHRRHKNSPHCQRDHVPHPWRTRATPLRGLETLRPEVGERPCPQPHSEEDDDDATTAETPTCQPCASGMSSQK